MSEAERPKLVAETDAAGTVTHVWLSMPGWKCARPVKGAEVHASLLSSSDIHGAPRQAVAAWLHQNGDLI